MLRKPDVLLSRENPKLFCSFSVANISVEIDKARRE